MTSPPLYDRVCDILEEGRNTPPHLRQQQQQQPPPQSPPPPRLAQPGMSASAPFLTVQR